MLSKMEHPPLEHRRISRAEREGSFLVTATVLTRNPLSSRGPAKNLRRQPTTQPLLLLIHHPTPPHSAPERPLTKYVPFWVDHQPQEKKGGVPLALSQIRRGGSSVEGSQERNGAGSFLVAAHRAATSPLHHPNSPPPTPHPTPFPHSLKHPFPTPQHTPTVLRTISLCLPYGLIALATRHNDTYNSCQARPLNSGTPPRCQPRATTKTSFSLATKSTL